MVEALFVYGTLRPGRENEGILKEIGGTFEEANIRGIHFPDGWLEDFPYPGVDLDQEGEIIEGYLFRSPDLYKYWGRLDAFEGPNYRRVVAEVCGIEQGLVKAYVYAINRDW